MLGDKVGFSFLVLLRSDPATMISGDLDIITEYLISGVLGSGERFFAAHVGSLDFVISHSSNKSFSEYSRKLLKYSEDSRSAHVLDLVIDAYFSNGNEKQKDWARELFCTYPVFRNGRSGRWADQVNCSKETNEL